IGLIVPDITNPFFAQLAKSIEKEADLRGDSIMLANSHDDLEAEHKHINILLNRSVRGILIVSASDSERPQIESKVPIVSLDRRYGDFPLVSTNHMEGSAQIAKHLYDLGHRNIAYIAGPQTAEVGRLRLTGFVNKLQELSRPHDLVNLSTFVAPFTYAGGETVARKLFAEPSPKWPTAIAAASDQIAIGALRVARDLKLDIPTDISITGFDDISLAELVVPRLTTLRQQTDLLAKHAVALAYEGGSYAADLSVSGKLIVRDSTGEPRPFGRLQ
ncbi:MAG: substrate-binding domain-containing protein, partial [Notoacmeibacter sp.]